MCPADLSSFVPATQTQGHTPCAHALLGTRLREAVSAAQCRVGSLGFPDGESGRGKLERPTSGPLGRAKSKPGKLVRG